jgi:PmbA protein
VSSAVGSIRPLEVAEIAVRKAIAAQNPEAIEPGEYTVILEPAAVADMLMFLGFLGFSALAAQEGRSFMCGQIGSRVMGDNITIWDDGLDPAGLPMPFDFEGVPKEKVVLIDRGIASGFVHDSATASQEDRLSTGHALPAPNTYGPMPINLFMAPGDSTLDEMISSTERGILVTRFHYTNPVHPVKVIITGMTRDGTFLVENGRVTRPVRNLRFTDSVPRAFSEVLSMSRERKLQAGYFGGALVPSMKVGRFAFTGATEF